MYLFSHRHCSSSFISLLPCFHKEQTGPFSVAAVTSTLTYSCPVSSQTAGFPFPILPHPCICYAFVFLKHRWWVNTRCSTWGLTRTLFNSINISLFLLEMIQPPTPPDFIAFFKAMSYQYTFWLYIASYICLSPFWGWVKSLTWYPSTNAWLKVRSGVIFATSKAI